MLPRRHILQEVNKPAPNLRICEYAQAITAKDVRAERPLCPIGKSWIGGPPLPCPLLHFMEAREFESCAKKPT